MSDNEKRRVLNLAYEAGRLLLENGAEIARVEETTSRIATAYGVEGSDFFVLSNGIFATAESYARVRYIPFKLSMEIVGRGRYAAGGVFAFGSLIFCNFAF